MDSEHYRIFLEEMQHPEREGMMANFVTLRRRESPDTDWQNAEVIETRSLAIWPEEVNDLLYRLLKKAVDHVVELHDLAQGYEDEEEGEPESMHRRRILGSGSGC